MVNNDLVKLISSHTSWTDLGESLNWEHQHASSKRQRIQFVCDVVQMWQEATESMEFEPDWSHGLPGTIVNTDDCKFVVHGIIHDAPFFPTSNAYKSFIRDFCSQYLFISETGLTQNFDLPPSVFHMMDSLMEYTHPRLYPFFSFYLTLASYPLIHPFSSALKEGGKYIKNAISYA